MPLSALRQRVVFYVSLSAIFLIALPAHGQTCMASTAPIAFGNLFSNSATAISTTGTVTVTCNPGVLTIGVNYTVTLSVGGGGSLYANRSMGNTGPRLKYQIYTDSARTMIWGDGSAGTSFISDGYTIGILFPITRNYTSYGLIPAAQIVSVGMFTDMVVVTLTY